MAEETTAVLDAVVDSVAASAVVEAPVVVVGPPVVVVGAPVVVVVGALVVVVGAPVVVVVVSTDNPNQLLTSFSFSDNHDIC